MSKHYQRLCKKLKWIKHIYWDHLVGYKHPVTKKRYGGWLQTYRFNIEVLKDKSNYTSPIIKWTINK